MKSHNLRYLASLKSVIIKVNELEETLTTVYSAGIANGFSKESLVRILSCSPLYCVGYITEPAQSCQGTPGTSASFSRKRRRSNLAWWHKYNPKPLNPKPLNPKTLNPKTYPNAEGRRSRDPLRSFEICEAPCPNCFLYTPWCMHDDVLDSNHPGLPSRPSLLRRTSPSPRANPSRKLRGLLRRQRMMMKMRSLLSEPRSSCSYVLHQLGEHCYDGDAVISKAFPR